MQSQKKNHTNQF